MDAIMNLLKSNQFWAVVVGVGGVLITNLVPEFAGRYEAIQGAIILLAVAIFGGMPLMEAIGDFLKRDEVNVEFDRAIGELRIRARGTDTPVDDILVNIADVIEDIIGNPDDSAEDDVTVGVEVSAA